MRSASEIPIRSRISARRRTSWVKGNNNSLSNFRIYCCRALCS
jgi:hypothetical protein